jgi:hypothetical protein
MWRVEIDDVALDHESHPVATGRDSSGGLHEIDLSQGPSERVVIPAQGEQWFVQRRHGAIVLLSRSDEEQARLGGDAQDVAVWSKNGVLEVKTGTHPYIIRRDCWIVWTDLCCTTAPVGAPVVVDISRVAGPDYDDTVFESALGTLDPPEIPDGELAPEALWVPEQALLVTAPCYLRSDVVGVGSTTAGEGLTVKVGLSWPV